MYPSIDTLSEILTRENYISPDDDTRARAVSGESGDEYVEFLLREQLLSKALLGQAIAEAFGIPYADLERTPPSNDDIMQLAEKDARELRLVVIGENDGVISLATDRPDIIDHKHIAKLFHRRRIELSYTLPEYVTQAFTHYAQPLEARLASIIEGGKRVAPELVDEIIRDALTYRASDIHLEPGASDVIVRFRIDGALREVGRLPLELYENVLNRIKVESGMRIDEHYSAQDGSLRLEVDAVAVDLRVSLVPTIKGEKVVMRVLGSYTRGLNVTDLGLSGDHRQKFEEAAHHPFGMILTTGPTGSGKTTSLYALLKLLNSPDRNITTIEDPVEYQLAGINQIQVRRSSDLDFVNGLRAIVRQDPDIILVGEIRDRETAEISVNAALTGHLLLSTFHANDAASSIPRLIDMGIEPFLLSSTLNLILAQRLLRKICAKCKTVVTLKQTLESLPEPLRYIGDYFSPHDSLYTGKGCDACGGSGYAGRSALFEMITVTPKMSELITKSPSALEIAELAHKEGMMSMFEDGLDKARAGVTTLSEVARVVQLPYPTKHREQASKPVQKTVKRAVKVDIKDA